MGGLIAFFGLRLFSDTNIRPPSEVADCPIPLSLRSTLRLASGQDRTSRSKKGGVEWGLPG